MKINIKAVSFKTDLILEDFIKNKIEKTAHLFDGVIGSEVILKIDKKQAVKNKITEIRFEIPGMDLFAKKQANTFEEATDLSIEALRKQLLKHKDKLRKKRA
jgi:putative sigma-54 modulation protein